MLRCCFAFSGKKVTPTFLQRKYVHHTYEVIAEHFHHTRFAAWPRVRNFVDSFEDGSIVYDVGCGNAKYSNRSDRYVLGTDVSPRLLEFALRKNQNAQLMASDILNLPIRSGACDGFLCTAVLHHLSCIETRMRALQELSRILKQKSKGLITVWCYEQELRNTEPIQEKKQLGSEEKGQNILIRWHLQEKYSGEIINNKEYEHLQEKKAVLVKRYYHLYRQGELEKLIGQVPSLKIVQAFRDLQNWCCIVQKN